MSALKEDPRIQGKDGGGRAGQEETQLGCPFPLKVQNNTQAPAGSQRKGRHSSLLLHSSFCLSLLSPVSNPGFHPAHCRAVQVRERKSSQVQQRDFPSRVMLRGIMKQMHMPDQKGDVAVTCDVLVI